MATHSFLRARSFPLALAPPFAHRSVGLRILADLSRRDSVKDGWVDVTHVVSMAGHKASGAWTVDGGAVAVTRCEMGWLPYRCGGGWGLEG